MKPKSFFLFTSLILLLSSVNYSCYAQNFWQQLNFPDTAKARSIAVNQEGYIFVGASNVLAAGGLYRSMDDGVSWEFLGFETRSANSIHIDYTGAIYAGFRNSQWWNGLFRSTDNGNTWTGILPDTGMDGNVVDILSKGDTIFACLSGNKGRVVRSVDYGLNWEVIFSTNMANEYVPEVVLTADGIIYICLQGYYTNMNGVLRSEDGGESWQWLHDQMTYCLALNSFDDLFAGSGSLIVRRNGETIWEPLVPLEANEILITPQDHIYFTNTWEGVIRSLDNGQSFEAVNEGLVNTSMADIDYYNGFLYTVPYGSGPYVYKSINILVSVPEQSIEDNPNPYNLYPNPADEYIMITGPKAQSNLVQVFNMLNQKVLEQNFEQNHKIDVSMLKPGMYLLRINGMSGQTKLMVK